MPMNVTENVPAAEVVQLVKIVRAARIVPKAAELVACVGR